MFTNLLKAAVATALTPVAVVVDVVVLPIVAADPNKGMFDTTKSMLNKVGDNINKALEK